MSLSLWSPLWQPEDTNDLPITQELRNLLTLEELCPLHAFALHRKANQSAACILDGETTPQRRELICLKLLFY